MKPALVAAWLFVVAGVTVAGVAPAAGRGTAQGAYTAAQAQEGARLYAMRCAMCHGARLEGTVETPELVGKFVANWGARPVSDLFEYVSRAMPQPAPGTLTPEDNARVVAYLLQVNGAPEGRRALPADVPSLRRIKFEAIPLR